MHSKKASLAAPERKKKTIKVFLLAVLLTGSLPLPAHSYYYSGYYRNWLYQIPYLGFSLVNRGGIGPYNANPVYSIPSLFRRTNGAYGSTLSTSPYVMEKYADEEPLGDPRDRFRPTRPGQLGVDETVHATWKPDPDPSSLPPTAPPLYQGSPNTAPGMMPHAPLQAASPQQPFPPGAPPHNLSNSASPNLPGAPLTVPPTVSLGNQTQSPIAQSFIERLNSKFDGNIDSALFDPETRSLAKMLGVVDHDSIFSADFSDSRKLVIKQILKDDKLGAAEKLQTLKILLSDGANRAMH